eukprot:1231124-Rhodomonas_salina.1
MAALCACVRSSIAALCSADSAGARSNIAALCSADSAGVHSNIAALCVADSACVRSSIAALCVADSACVRSSIAVCERELAWKEPDRATTQNEWRKTKRDTGRWNDKWRRVSERASKQRGVEGSRGVCV